MLEKAHQLSHSNRAESDKLQAKAEEILKQIDELKAKQ